MYMQRPPAGANAAVNLELLARVQAADKRLNAAGTTVGAALAKQLRFNRYPNDYPFFTNRAYQDENGGLPLQANSPEPEQAQRPAAGGPVLFELTASSVVLGRTVNEASCVNCKYL